MKIIALGNSLRGDDGAGPAVLSYLQQDELPDQVALIDAGADAFTVLDHLLQPDPIILIDCARMGKKPGEVAALPLTDFVLRQTEQLVSLHGFSVAEVYQLAKEIGSVAECVIIGVEPASLEFNSDLSPAVRKSIPAAARLVRLEMRKNAEKNNNH